MARERYWPKWWWRYPLSTGIFSPRVDESEMREDRDQRLDGISRQEGVMTVPSTAEARRLKKSLRSHGYEIVPRDLLEAVVDDQRVCEIQSGVCRAHDYIPLVREKCPVGELRRLLTQGSSS